MMSDKVLAFLSLLALVGFMGIAVVYVRELDLAIVVILCLLVGIYHFRSEIRALKGGGGSGG